VFFGINEVILDKVNSFEIQKLKPPFRRREPHQVSCSNGFYVIPIPFNRDFFLRGDGLNRAESVEKWVSPGFGKRGKPALPDGLVAQNR
jgi:hypothetical protein